MVLDDAPDGARVAMPTAALRPCPGCRTALVPRGRCTKCAKTQDRARGTSTERGYGSYWRRFRPQFISILVEAGITPVCGAALPTGPQTQDSQCKAEGRQTMEGLHLDHEPPLTEAERKVRAIVCRETRIQILCRACHSAKTSRQLTA